MPGESGHFERFNHLIEKRLSDLTVGQLKVALVFLRHADDSGVTWPGPSLIAKRAGMTERAVYRSIRELKEMKILCDTDVGGGGGKVTKRVILPGESLTGQSVTPELRVTDPPVTKSVTPRSDEELINSTRTPKRVKTKKDEIRELLEKELPQ